MHRGQRVRWSSFKMLKSTIFTASLSLQASEMRSVAGISRNIRESCDSLRKLRMASRWLSNGNSCVRRCRSRLALPLILSSAYRSGSRKVARLLPRLKPWGKKKKKERGEKGQKGWEEGGQDKKERRKAAGGQRIRMRNEARSGENREKGTGGKERRLPWRLIVSENPSSRSFCFRFYFLPSNPPVHCLPFVHTVPRASPIPASRDFYLVTFQAFLSPIWLFSHCTFSSL